MGENYKLYTTLERDIWVETTPQNGSAKVSLLTQNHTEIKNIQSIQTIHQF